MHHLHGFAACTGGEDVKVLFSMLRKTISSVNEGMWDCLKPYKKLPAPIHGKAVAPCPPIPSAQLSPHQPQTYLGTEGGSHETLSHADLRCGGLQGKPETCVLQYHERIVSYNKFRVRIAQLA